MKSTPGRSLPPPTWVTSCGTPGPRWTSSPADEKAAKPSRKAKSGIQRDYNAENGNSITLTSGRFSEGDTCRHWPMLPQEPVRKAPFATYEGGGDETVLVHVGAVRSPEPKTPAEARGQVIAAYQDHLEAEWIEALRAGRLSRLIAHYYRPSPTDATVGPSAWWALASGLCVGWTGVGIVQGLHQRRPASRTTADLVTPQRD